MVKNKFILPVAAFLLVALFFVSQNVSFSALPADCRFVSETITTGGSGAIAACDSDRCVSKFDLKTQLNVFRSTPWHINIKQEIAQPFSAVTSCAAVTSNDGVPPQSYAFEVQNDLTKGETMVYTGFAYGGGSCGQDNEVLQVTRTNTLIVDKYQCGLPTAECTTEGAAQCSNNVAQVCNNGFWSDTEQCPTGTSCSAAGTAWACVGTVACADGKKIGETRSCGNNGYQTCQYPGVYSTCTQPAQPIQVAGNGICEPPETYLNTPSDCHPPNNIIPEGGICNPLNQYKCDTGLICDAIAPLNGICKQAEGGKVCAAEGESVGGILGIGEKSCCSVSKDGTTPLVKNKAGICVKQSLFDSPMIVAGLAGVLAGLLAMISFKKEDSAFKFAISAVIALLVGVLTLWLVEFAADNILLLAGAAVVTTVLIVLGGRFV